MQTMRSYFLWVIYAISSLLLSVWLAWHLSAQMNFLYPIWYSVLNIDQTISEVAPRHLYKKQFSQTTNDEHVRLFKEIVDAVQHHGRGLEEIQFYDENSKRLGKLLTQSEVTHLQDVANLINLLNWWSLILLVFSLLMLALLFLVKAVMPTIKMLFLNTVTVVLIISLVIVVAGPTKLFYWLHTVIFPEGHQWFFYYEESLMSLLMKAPVLFAPLAMQLVLLGFIIWGLHLLLLTKLGFSRSA